MEGTRGLQTHDPELVTKAVQVEQKLFYLDLKENARGRYLKISEKTAGLKSTIIVPAAGIIWFVDLFHEFAEQGSVPGFELTSKELRLDTKIFYFDAGENSYGRFLKISEASTAGRGRSTIIVPAGGGDTVPGWAAFRDVLEELGEAAQHPATVRAPGLPAFVQEGAAGTYPGYATPAVPLEPAEPRTTMEATKVVVADNKRIFLDLGNNVRGRFLRISEVAGSNRSSIVIPISALDHVYEVVGQYVDAIKSGAAFDNVQGRVRTVTNRPPQAP